MVIDSAKPTLRERQGIELLALLNLGMRDGETGRLGDWEKDEFQKWQILS
jgi:hypothetical protein